MTPDFKKVKAEFVMQHGQSDCGVACLASIIKHHGGLQTQDKIRQVSGTTKVGTSLLGLAQGAESLGFDAAGLEAEGIHNLTELDTPAILHIILDNKMQHYVVFYGFEGNKLIVGDPGRGVELWDQKKVNDVWQSKALLRLQPNSSFKLSIKKKNQYKYLIDWVKEDQNILLSSLFLGVLIAILSIATAIFSQKLIDVILPAKDILKLTIGLVLFGFIMLARNGLSFVRSTFLITQSRAFNTRMISSFFKSMLNLPKSFFDSKKTGEMIARMNDTKRIQSVLSNLMGNLLVEFLVIITSLIGIFLYSAQVGTIVLGFIPFYILILWKFKGQIIEAQKGVMRAYGSNESNYVDVITGIECVKGTNSSDLFHKTTTALYTFYQDQVFRLGKIGIRFSVLTETVGVVLIIIVTSFSAVMVLQDSLALGAMMAMLSLAVSVGPSLARIAIFDIQIQEAKVAFNRMEEFTGLDPEAKEGRAVDTIKKIRLEGLSFHYPGSVRLLENISLSVHKGKISALLGESGSGKSTILQLIQRFYNPVKGQVLVNNTDLQELSIELYRKKVSVVPQEIKVFNDNLLFNICLSEKQSEHEEVISWCRRIGFDQFFSKFPNGYMTILGEEGINISGGQRQLLGLARALYRSPEIIILDEGTGAMDRETEKVVMDMLQGFKSKMGILMVTHKLNTAIESDQVHLLEEGRIIDTGDPRKLLKKNNFFSKMYHEMLDLNI